jgi:hypothetical protein
VLLYAIAPPFRKHFSRSSISKKLMKLKEKSLKIAKTAARNQTINKHNNLSSLARSDAASMRLRQGETS